MPMIPPPEKFDPLEQSLRTAVRGLPLRRAPESLEQRVLAEIARRVALPWWRKSFVHWPVAARAGFILLCAGVVKSVLMGAVWLMAGFDTAQFKAAFAQEYSWFEKGVTVFHAMTGFIEILLRNIPSGWLYAGLLVFAAMYATLFGIGAAAYKAVRAPR
jgi:hypothetical protein